MRNITETGIRGYLKWLKDDQPELYRLAAPIIANKIPGAFSDHEQSRAMGYLSDTTGGAIPTFLPGISPYDGDGTDSSGASSGVQPEVSDAANVGAASPSIGQDIANIVAGIANAWNGVQVTNAQIKQINAINQQQIARAVAGGTPMQVSSSSMGIPILTPIVSEVSKLGSSGLLWGVAAVVGLLLLSSAHRRSA